MSEKDTIYVDVDDEITIIIDKVTSSPGRIVALVLPKRASVFQSIVNMKLLKRAADGAKKNVVLITTEANLMPLAGSVGLHVAATPQSKPEIPSAAEPDTLDAEETVSDSDAYTADNAGDRPVGELAETTGHVIGAAGADMVNLADDDEEGETSAPRQKKDRSLHVPNFNLFRMRLMLACVALIILIVGLYVCLVVLPAATIAISTDTSTVNVNLNLSLDTAAQALDTTKLVVPAKGEQQQKTTSQQVDTTGVKNTGTAATGSVTMTAAKCGGNPFNKLPTVPAGAGVSTNGLTFITQQATTFSTSGAFLDSNGCYDYPATSSTLVTAQTGGTKYNVSNATFVVTGVVTSDQNATSVSASATGSTNGGTDNIIHIVAQTDIDSAKQKLTSQDTSSVQATLEQQLRTDGMYPLSATFNAGTPVVTTSANVGDQADNVTVTEAVTYTMLGVKQADLDTLIHQSVDSHINAKEQTILDDGLQAATINVTGTSGTAEQISLQTQATVGPAINPADIKRQAAGKKAGDVQTLINAIPGVTSVDVRLSPFWVSTVPSNASKVTVTVGKH